ESLADRLGVEDDAREDLGVGVEGDGGAAAALAGLLALHLALRPAALEEHAVLVPVAQDGGGEVGGERVDDGRAHAVQPAGRLVVLPLELAAGVEGAEDDLERGLLELRVDVDGDAA